MHDTQSAPVAQPLRISDPWQALADLVAACDGEVEEVFGGEIGDALAAARNILAKRKHASEAWAALKAEIGKLDADYPNYGDWPIQLPAGYWRAILDASSVSESAIDGADVGRALKALVDGHPDNYKAAIADPALRDWFVEKIVEEFGDRASKQFVTDMVHTVFETVLTPVGN
jgi:hypothetical protein|nr:hypothetical protein [Neorhizobium tomejilense]